MIAAQLAALAVPVDTLTPLPGNPRRGDVEAVAKSLQRFGQRKPIVVNADGTIIAGNHTHAAAVQLGWAEIAAVRVEDDEDTATAFALADNRTGDLGGYDDEALLALLVELDSLEGTGYTADDVEALSHLWDEPLDLDDLQDEFGEPTEEDLLTRLVIKVQPDVAKAWGVLVGDRDPGVVLQSLIS